MPSSRRPKPKHWIEYAIYRSFEGLLSIFSVRSTFLIGEFIGKLGFRLLPSYRKLVLRNLRFAYGGERSPAELQKMVPLIFERTAANFLSALKIPTVDEDEIRKHVTFEGEEHLENVIVQNEGGILIVPHMGNWELLAQAIFLSGYPLKIGTYYRPLNNPILNKLIERRRSQRGVQLFPKKTSSHQLTSFIRANGILGILSDQRVGIKGEPVVFFGRPTTSSPLPSLLTRRAKTHMIGLRCITTGIGKWKVSLSDVAGPSIQQTASCIEKLWRSSPEDVFWFEDRWKLDGPHLKKFFAEKYQSLPTSKTLRLAHILTDVSHDFVIPKSPLVKLEQYLLEPSLSDLLIAQMLDEIEAHGAHPVDAFIVKERLQPRIQRLTSKIAVIAEESLDL